MNIISQKGFRFGESWTQCCWLHSAGGWLALTSSTIVPLIGCCRIRPMVREICISVDELGRTRTFKMLSNWSNEVVSTPLIHYTDCPNIGNIHVVDFRSCQIFWVGWSVVFFLFFQMVKPVHVLIFVYGSRCV